MRSEVELGTADERICMRTKYGAQKTVVDGIKFSSRLEAERFQQLKLLEQAGEISDLHLQHELQIFQGYVDPQTGEKKRSSFYLGDFFYVDVRSHKLIVEDTKGVETPEFRLKWKLAQSQYPEYEFRKVTRDMV